MAREDDELGVEKPELMAQRIRDHLRQADAKRSTDPKAAGQHDVRATELIERLSRQQLGKAQAYAQKAFGRSFELYEEAIVETFILLDRALRNYETRKGLEERFDATFHSIAVDAIRVVARSNRGLTGDEVAGQKIVSADNVADESDGWTPDQNEDKSAVWAFMSMVDATAFDAIAFRMPVRQLEVLRLRAEGYDFMEIANRLKINRDTASSDYQKALTFIKNHLTPDNGGETK